MRLVISYIDHAPDDLLAQAPIAVGLIMEMPGADRPDYWLGRLKKPFQWKHDGQEDEILHVVIAARWVGTRIGREWMLPVEYRLRHGLDVARGCCAGLREVRACRDGDGSQDSRRSPVFQGVGCSDRELDSSRDHVHATGCSGE